MTAEELMAELEADPEWVAARDARARRRELDEIESRNQQAHLLADLAAVGIDVANVWRLNDSFESYRAAVPVLLDHLQRHYEPGIREGIARALAFKDAVPYWDAVMALFRGPDPDDLVQMALGVALSEMATRSELPQVREVLQDRSLPSRVFLLGTLTRLRAPDRWDFIEEMVDDPALRVEAMHLLHQRELREAAKARRSGKS